MVVTNFDGTLEVGVAFQLLIRNLPVRRGIVMSVDPTTKAPHIWCENKTVKRVRGDSHVFIGIYEGFSNDNIPELTITPIPGVFDSWLSRVPAQVRIACGSIRVRPGPKVRVPAASSNLTHSDLVADFVNSPGFSLPRSLSPTEDMKTNVPKNNRVQMTSKLEKVCVTLDILDNKLEAIMHELKQLKKELTND